MVRVYRMKNRPIALGHLHKDLKGDKTISIRFTPDRYNEIHELAELNKISFSLQVNELLEKALDVPL